MRSAEEMRKEIALAINMASSHSWVGAFQIANAILPLVRQAQVEAIEEAAKVVDQCNSEGPYTAIGAAARIRSLKKSLGGER